MKKRNRAGTILLLLFGLFWTALVAPIDVIVGVKTFRQIASAHFPSVTGRITHSELTQDFDETIDYGVDIRYQYEVNGQSFKGHRFRYNQGGSSDSTWAEQAIARYPVGAIVPVFYNPENPADALLSVGVNGTDLILILFLTPFTVVMVAFGMGAMGWMSKKFTRPVAGGVKIMEDGRCVRVRLPKWSPLVAGLTATGGVAFIEIFVLLIPFGFHPPLAGAVIALIVAYGAGLGAYIQRWQKIHAGEEDLIIDKGLGVVQLPKAFDRKERMAFHLPEVLDVIVDTLTHTNSENNSVSYTYAPTVRLRGGKTEGEKLADWNDLESAEAFVGWLRQQFGLPELRK